MKRAFFAAMAMAVLLWAGAACAADRIGEERAKQIAFDHAGVASSEVRMLRSGLDWEDGAEVYDIEFISGTTKYEYEVAASSGSIVKFERKEGATARGASEAGGITQERAQQIAFEHAGVDRSNIRKLSVKRDRERGRWVYEVEFKSAGWEYDYEIDASTGEIIKWDKEYD